MRGLRINQRSAGGALEEKASVRVGRYVQATGTTTCVVELFAWSKGGALTSALPEWVAAMHSAQTPVCGAEVGSCLEGAEPVGCVSACAATACCVINKARQSSK